MVQVDPQLIELVSSAFRPANLPPKPDRERLHHLAQVDRVLTGERPMVSTEESASASLWRNELINQTEVTEQMKRLWIEYGLPGSDIRRVMWSRVVREVERGAETTPLPSKDEYSKLIQLDLERTLPFLGIFNENNGKMEACAECLALFAQTHPLIGYTQGMSYICVRVMIELGFDPVAAQPCLERILVQSPTLACMYRLNREEMTRTVEFVLDAIAWDNIPHVWLRFKKIQFQVMDYFVIEWILTMFVKGFSMKISGFVFDQFFVSGDIAIYRVIIAILSIIQDRVCDSSLDTETTRTIVINANSYIPQFKLFVKAYHDVHLSDTIRILVEKGVTYLS
jgi:hypothetical protein